MDRYEGIGFLLNDIGRLMRVSFDRKTAPTGLTRAQWSVLAHLKRHEAIKQAELANLLEVDPVTVTRLVDRLVAAGMVERGPDPRDRRVHRLTLTDKAAPYLDRMGDVAAAVREEALDGLEPAEIEAFIGTAERIRANLSRARSRNAGRETAGSVK